MLRHLRDLVDEDEWPFELLPIHVLPDELDHQPPIPDDREQHNDGHPEAQDVLSAPFRRSAAPPLRLLAEAPEDLREPDGEDRATDDEAACAEGTGGGPRLERAVQVPGEEQASAEAEAEPVIPRDEEAEADDGEQQDRRPEEHAVVR